MQPVSAIVVFVMIWWSVFFCVLPIGQRTHFEEQDEDKPYVAPGSPTHLNLKKKVLITTGISIALWIIAYFIIQSEVINFREMAKHG